MSAGKRRKGDAVTATEKQPKKMGRPLKIVGDEKTLQTLAGLAKIQCTTKEAAAVLGISEPTFIDFLKRTENAREVWEANKHVGRASLRRTQFKLAETNVAMSIWLGKQYLEQNDKAQHEVSGPGGGPIPYQKIERVIVDPSPRPEDEPGAV
jgi:hypothetical protein